MLKWTQVHEDSNPFMAGPGRGAQGLSVSVAALVFGLLAAMSGNAWAQTPASPVTEPATKAGAQGSESTPKLKPLKGAWLELGQGAMLSTPSYFGGLGGLGGLSYSAYGAISVGYRWPKVMLGVAVRLGGSTSSGEQAGTSGTEEWKRSSFNGSVSPVVDVVLLKRGRLELFLRLLAGVGYARDKIQSPEQSSQSIQVSGLAAFGCRYFVLPRLALGLTLGGRVSWGRSQTGQQGLDYDYVSESVSGGLDTSFTMAFVL